MTTTGTIRAWRAWHEPIGLDGYDWCYEAYDGTTRWFGRTATEAQAVEYAQASLERILSLAAMRHAA